MPQHDVVVIGAGPYGLSAAAHLESVGGLSVRTFGPPMSFWACHMPRGMLLRSPWAGSHIAGPNGRFSLDEFCSAAGIERPTPLPLDRFVEYGHWFRQQVVKDIDPRYVQQVRPRPGGYAVIAEDGEEVHTRRVVIAAGIEKFAWRPPVFKGLSPDFVSHSCDHRDLGRFAQRQVLVVGGGQSALESAALLAECGASPEVMMRTKVLRFLRQKLHTLGKISSVLYAPADVGPAGLSQLVARPNWFRTVPRPLRDRLSRRSIRPAGAKWLEPRLGNVLIATGASVVSAVRRGAHVEVLGSDGRRRVVDHVLLATGYRVQISHYSFLAPEILAKIRQDMGSPLLNSGFETSLPGLHFLGAPAALSFGPLMRFVAGTSFTAPALTRWIVSNWKGIRQDQ